MRLTTQTLSLFLGTTCGLLLASTGAGCGGDDPMEEPTEVKCTAEKVTGASNKYATNALKMPKSSGSMTYASDIDGDGKTENQLKTLVQAVSVAGLNIQDPVNMAVAGGDAVILADLMSPDLMKSSCAGVTLALAQSPKMGDPLPKFDGADNFKIGEVMGIKLYGKIEGGKLSTTPSKEQTSADEQRITLSLPIGDGAMLPLSIRGVHIEGTLSMDKGQPVITDGAIHGVISKKDIDGKIVPTVAQLVTGMIHDKPMDSTTMTIISLFENMANDVSKMKCANTPMKCCKTNVATCEILPAEVLASPVGGVLSADVEALDSNDAWKPVAGGKNKNAMSVGLGFTMIKASF
jgi:hypothetical protein